MHLELVIRYRNMPSDRVLPAVDRFDLRAQAYSPERVGQYNDAIRLFPLARAKERQLVIDRLDLRPGLVIVDAGAGGGYLSEGIFATLAGNCRIVCVENSQSYIDTIDARFETSLSSLSQIGLADCMADRVACLAGLHHQERKFDFFREAARILRPGGKLVVADVLADSPPARFLNVSVDRYTELGHDGMFTRLGEFSQMMHDAGLVDIHEQHEQFTWDLPDLPSLVLFCKMLFRMGRATVQQVKTELDRFLDITLSSAGAHLHWSLVCASGCKPRSE
jgi:SAM-dependent methyltransferase